MQGHNKSRPYRFSLYNTDFKCSAASRIWPNRLRESGAIEQDADEVMFLYREDYYNKDTPEQNVAERIVAKNRHGETGTVKLQWLPQFTTFADREWRHDEG